MTVNLPIAVTARTEYYGQVVAMDCFITSTHSITTHQAAPLFLLKGKTTFVQSYLNTAVRSC